jgi:exonuclease SbcD
LHFADFHLGIENYGHMDSGSGLSTRIIDFLQRLDEMAAYAKDHAADMVIFAGDAFKNRQPNPTLQREFAWRVRDMAALCPVVLLTGNHDLPSTLQRASSLEIYDTLSVPNVLVGDKYELYNIPTPSGPVLVGTAPYPLRGQLLSEEQAQNKTIMQIDGLLQEALQSELSALADKSLVAEPLDAPRVLTGHFSVTGAKLGSERSVMVGRDATVLLSELDSPAWDYVALGHIHKHQNLTAGRKDAPPVVYSGSAERIDFGEENDAKGFCWVEVERHQTRWEFVPVRSRPFVTLRVDVRQSADPMQKVLSAIRGAALEEAVVRLIIQADDETEKQIHDNVLYGVLRDCKVDYIAAIKKEVERPIRARLGGSPEELSPLELLERYFRAKDFPPDQISQLMERAEELLADKGAPEK